MLELSISATWIFPSPRVARVFVFLLVVLFEKSIETLLRVLFSKLPPRFAPTEILFDLEVLLRLEMLRVFVVRFRLLLSFPS